MLIHMVVHVCFGACVYMQGQLAPPCPLGKQGPAGGAGHGPARVQPGLTLAMDPAGGQRGESEEEENEK